MVNPHRSPTLRPGRPTAGVIGNEPCGQGYEGLKTSENLLEACAPSGSCLVGSKWTFKWKANEFWGKHVNQRPAWSPAVLANIREYVSTRPVSPAPQAPLTPITLSILTPNRLPSSRSPAKGLYTKPPPGCCGAAGQLVRTARSIYGLKQAWQCWHALLARQPERSSLERCRADPVHLSHVWKTWGGGGVTMALSVRVGDMIAAGRSVDYGRLSVTTPAKASR